MFKDLNTIEDALSDVLDFVKDAEKSERFIVVIGWISDDDEKIEMRRTTFKFPANKLVEFAEMVNGQMVEETVRIDGTPPAKEPDPLPRRSPFRPPMMKGENHAAETDRAVEAMADGPQGQPCQTTCSCVGKESREAAQAVRKDRESNGDGSPEDGELVGKGRGEVAGRQQDDRAT